MFTIYSIENLLKTYCVFPPHTKKSVQRSGYPLYLFQKKKKDTVSIANAGLLAAQVIALHDESVRSKLIEFRANQTEKVLSIPDPRDA